MKLLFHFKVDHCLFCRQELEPGVFDDFVETNAASSVLDEMLDDPQCFFARLACADDFIFEFDDRANFIAAAGGKQFFRFKRFFN